MGITIQAENVHDAAGQLGLPRGHSDINITWRKGDLFSSDGRHHDTGCIVDATGIQSEEVKRAFKTSAEALRYIASLLKRHDDYARKQKQEHEKHLREMAKKAKGEKKCS